MVKIKLSDIDSFKNHPFKVNKDDSLQELITSIRENGLLNPLVVRRKENGRFEMISGHRRKLALELIGVEETGCYIETLNDYEAIIYM
ncbi:MAG: ParB N-terminal domain-containing protein, partial [Bacilli bacterium]|nr:ParB N-terminal domain-containing protein [Bacilli bacterium]